MPPLHWLALADAREALGTTEPVLPADGEFALSMKDTNCTAQAYPCYMLCIKAYCNISALYRCLVVHQMGAEWSVLLPDIVERALFTSGLGGNKDRFALSTWIKISRATDPSFFFFTGAAQAHSPLEPMTDVLPYLMTDEPVWRGGRAVACCDPPLAMPLQLLLTVEPDIVSTCHHSTLRHFHFTHWDCGRGKLIIGFKSKICIEIDLYWFAFPPRLWAETTKKHPVPNIFLFLFLFFLA